MNEDSLSVRGGQTPFEGLSIRGAAQWSQDTAVAYILLLLVLQRS